MRIQLVGFDRPCRPRGKFSNEEIAFGGGLRCAFDVAGCLRLLDVLVNLVEASPGGVLGSRVEDLPESPNAWDRPAVRPPTRTFLPAWAAERSSTWNSRPGSARSRARYRRSRIRTVRPSNTTDQSANRVRGAGAGAVPRTPATPPPRPHRTTRAAGGSRAGRPGSARAGSQRPSCGTTLHRLGPFLGQVVLRESQQRANRFAVDEPGRERIEVPGDSRHSRFVE